MGKGTTYGFWNAPFAPEDIGLHSKRDADAMVVAAVKRAVGDAWDDGKWKASVALMGTAAGLGAVES
jgi:hypothetical protein